MNSNVNNDTEISTLKDSLQEKSKRLESLENDFEKERRSFMIKINDQNDMLSDLKNKVTDCENKCETMKSCSPKLFG